MAGRHTAAGTSSAGRGRRGLPAVLVTAAVVIVGVSTAVAVTVHHRGQPDQGTPAAACAGTVSVPVVAAPEVEPTIRAIATRWTSDRPAARGRCIAVSVSGQSPAQTEHALAVGGASRATVWVPDSSMWSAVLTSTVPALAPVVHTSPPVATSPVVVAASPAAAQAVDATAAHGWGAALTTGTPMALPDPLTTTAGTLVALAVQGQAGSAPGAAAATVGTYLRLSTATVASTSAALSTLSTRPAVASERDVVAAVRADPPLDATAVYPGGPTPVLDFPVVLVTPAGTDPAVREAMTELERQLSAPAASARFTADGFRDATGAPVGGAATGVSGQAVTALPTPDAARLAVTTRLWRAALRPSNLLAVIDVSGSMADPSGTGQSKIQVTADAAVGGMALLPESWRVGLWSFSTRTPPATDWTELVPLGPVSTQRTTLQAAAAALPARVRGNTGLYSTALAAFEHVRAQYQPDSVNIVTLLTDGEDVDPNGPDLPTLLDRLKQEFDPAHPVRIVTIGIGSGADQAALKAISDATGGQTYQVIDPSQIGGVLLDAIVANN